MLGRDLTPPSDWIVFIAFVFPLRPAGRTGEKSLHDPRLRKYLKGFPSSFDKGVVSGLAAPVSDDRIARIAFGHSHLLFVGTILA